MVSLAAAIQFLYPSAQSPWQYCVVSEGQTETLKGWSQELGAPPTEEQIAAAIQAVQQIEAARQQILGSFRSLPRGVQAFFEPVRAEVDAAISARDWQGVRDIIATAPTPTPELDAIRLQFADLANQLLPQ